MRSAPKRTYTVTSSARLAKLAQRTYHGAEYTLLT